MRQIANTRIIGLLFGVTCVGASLWYGREALRLDAEFHEWLVARPAETTIDLSRPGVTTVPFRQTCDVSHGEALCLQTDLENDPTEDLEQTFADLSGTIVIHDLNGNQIQSAEINSETVHRWNGDITLTGFAPFRKGDYSLTIRVDSGASALSNQQQVIFAKYQLCGLERMPAMITGAFALATGLLGLVVVSCAAPGLIRSGIYRESIENA